MASLIGTLEKKSTRRKCKHGIKVGDKLIGVLQRMVEDAIVEIEDLNDIEIGDVIYVFDDSFGVMETGPIEHLRVNDNSIEFITNTESYCFIIKE